MKKFDCRLASESERTKWLEESRMDAILGASSRSHKSVRSGIRCWIAFVGVGRSVFVCLLLAVNCSCTDQFDPDKKKYFPPPLDLLLSWTTLFRSGGTLRNYLGYLQTGCLMVDAPTQVSLFSWRLQSLGYDSSTTGLSGTGAQESQGVGGRSRQFQTS